MTSPAKNRDNRKGALIARALAGSWRRDPPTLELSPAEIDTIAPLLLGNGAGPLLWRRLQSAPDTMRLVGASSFTNEYRWAAIHFVLGTKAIEALADMLAGEGITFLLFKGRSLTRYYCDPLCRPMGDIDIWVEPQHYLRAANLLECKRQGGAVASPGHDRQVVDIDLHRDLKKFRLPNAADLLARAETLKFGNSSILVPGASDHLRLLCMHFLIHGGWRPIWLCDIAAMAEAMPADFDWNEWLGTEEPLRNQLSTAIGLAHELLGAKPVWRPTCYLPRPPRWVSRAVMAAWAKSFEFYHPPETIRASLRDRKQIGRVIQARWPSPVRAIVDSDTYFDNRPRWPYQAMVFVDRLRAYLSARSSERA